MAGLAGGLLLAMVVVTTTLAHGGDGRVDLGSATVVAGGSVEVRLVSMAPGDELRVELIGSGQAVATVSPESLVADADGDAVGAFNLPADLAPGQYVVRAIASDGHAVETPLTVQAAVADGGVPGGREEDDPLLVALPSGWQRSLSAAPAAGSGLASTDWWIDPSMAALLGGVGTLLLLRLAGRSPKRPSLP